MSIKRNLRVGRMSSEGRLFQIEFWEEDFYGTVLSWVGVYEVLEVGRCGKHTEQLKEIKTCWTDDDRLELARAVVAKTIYLSLQKKIQDAAIDEFCRSGKFPDPPKPPNKGASVQKRV